jgi:putative intracellular protease/amidase
MDNVVPAQLLEALSQLLQEVPRSGLRDLPVALDVVAQVATSAELQHNEQSVIVLQGGTYSRRIMHQQAPMQSQCTRMYGSQKIVFDACTGPACAL